MTRKQGNDGAGKQATSRQERLKEALKANLRRRKQQLRARKAPQARKD